MDELISTPNKALAAVCGLFCPACPIYIGTHEDSTRLKRFARLFHCSVEEMECDGCRTDKRCIYCRDACKMTRCAAEKGLDFCGQCAEYPCPELTVFQAERPNRLELWLSQERIAEVGFEQWYTEMIDHYTCPECGTINSALDLVCRACGADPSCEYVRVHKEELLEYMARASANAQ